MPRFSIITPQYNSFDLMENYFKSLAEQSFKDFEVIIIDDCSTDDSYQQLSEYVHRSPLNIRLLQSLSNKGPGNARNMGIDAATGEWITFVDNDDWVVSDYLERVNQVIERESVHCVIYDYYTYLNGKTAVARSMYVGENGRKSISECVVSVRNHTIGKFYKLSDCGHIRFPDIRRCEDVAYVTQAVIACGGAYYLKEPLYYYRQRPTSLSNNKRMDECDLLKAFAILEEQIGSVYPLELKEKSVPDALYGVCLTMCKAGKSKRDILSYISKYEQKYPQWWNCASIKYLGKPKQLFLKCVRKRFVFGMKVIAYLHSLMIKRGA